MSISKPDPAARAAERLPKVETPGETPASSAIPPKRGRGRPPGSKNTPKDAPKIERTPEDIEQGKALCAFLCATLWGLLAPMVKHRDISDEEAKQLGAAVDPVLAKYLPGIIGYGLEINLVIVVAAIWQSTTIPDDKALPKQSGKKETPKPGRLEIVE